MTSVCEWGTGPSVREWGAGGHALALATTWRGECRAPAHLRAKEVLLGIPVLLGTVGYTYLTGKGGAVQAGRASLGGGQSTIFAFKLFFDTLAVFRHQVGGAQA